MVVSLKYFVAVSTCCVVAMAASASFAEQFLKVPLFDVGGLWVRAVRDFWSNVLLAVGKLDLTSPWTYVVIVSVSVVLYYTYVLFFVPLNRVRLLGDLGYVPDARRSMRQVANDVRKRRQVGDLPPVYPNGWFGIAESRELKVGEVKDVSCLGLSLAVFRGESGQPHAIDAYCPHLGANMAVGGRVFGECLECPFHGWRMSGEDGKCTHIPYAERIPDIAKVKSYNVLERNGYIYLWYHAEGIEPNWFPPEIPEIKSGEWVYQGRTEHHVNSHIEEIPENGSDLAHLPQVHGPLMTAGIDLRHTYSKFWEFGKHQWKGEWSQGSNADEKHIGTLNLTHCCRLFGIRIPLLDMDVCARQIGPGIVYLTYKSIFGRGAYIHSLTPMEPLMQRIVHQVWMHKRVPIFIAKFFLLGEALMLERDIMIWNNKRYRTKPVYVKCIEDQMIVRHRRWYSQFYSEHSPRFKFSQDTMEW